MSDCELKIDNVRLAFAKGLFDNTPMNAGDKPAYSCNFILPKNHTQLKQVQEALKQVAQGKWGAKAPEILKALVAGGKVCLRDGDSKTADGFAGNLFIAARNAARPIVIDADKSVLTEADGKPYSGCYVNAKVRFWAQDNAHGKRINAQLLVVQFYKDGDSFGGSAPPSPDLIDEFGDVSGADGATPDDSDEFGGILG